MELRLILFLLLIAAVVAIVLVPARRKPSRSDAAAQDPPTVAPVPGPDLSSINLNQRLPVPKRRGKTPKQIAEEDAQYCAKMRLRSRASFERNRANAAKAHSTHYIWRTSNDADVCPVCKGKEGRKFRWDAKGAVHPGDCDQCTAAHCRCYPEAVLPRI